MAMLEATIHYRVKKSLFQTFRTSRAFPLDSHNEEKIFWKISISVGRRMRQRLAEKSHSFLARNNHHLSALLCYFFAVPVSYPIDIAFAISASGRQASELYTYMTDVIKLIIDRYGMYYIHYAFMVFGSQPDVKVTFANEINTPDDLKGFLDDAIRVGGQPDLQKALNKATELFEPDYAGERPGVKKFLVVIVDRNTVGDERFVMRYSNVLTNSGVKVILSS